MVELPKFAAFNQLVDAYFIVQEDGPLIIGDVTIHPTAKVDPTAVLGIVSQSVI